MVCTEEPVHVEEVQHCSNYFMFSAIVTFTPITSRCVLPYYMPTMNLNLVTLLFLLLHKINLWQVIVILEIYYESNLEQVSH